MTRGHLSQSDELCLSRISLMVFYLSITKKPQLAEIGPGTFLSALGLKMHIFYRWREDTFGHKAKTGLNAEYKV